MVRSRQRRPTPPEAAPPSYGTYAFPGPIEVADANGDGWLDLIVAGGAAIPP